MSELTEDDVIRLADKCFKTFFRKYFQYEESSGIVDGKTVYFRRLVANGVFDTESIKSDVAIDKIYINGEEMIAVDGMLQPATDKETADEIVNRLDRIDKTNKAIREKYGLPDLPKDSDSSEDKTPHATSKDAGVYSDVPPYT